MTVTSTSKTKSTINNADLQTIKRRFALATITIPTVGAITALLTLWQWGIGWLEISLLVSMYFLSLIGITVGFHRHFAHKAFAVKPMVRIVLGILGSIAAQGPLINWISTHRCHHQYSDRPGDPHSPYFHHQEKLSYFQGLWHAHIGWMINGEMVNSARFAKDLLQDRAIATINRMYLVWVALGLIIPAIFGGVLTWTWLGVLKGFFWGGLVRIFLVHQITWSVNSICHSWGTRSFDTQERSTNNVWLAIFSLGETWHNNHHAFPYSAIFGLKWWQIDIGGWTIRLLEKIGLVWDIKKPNEVNIAAKEAAQT